MPNLIIRFRLVSGTRHDSHLIFICPLSNAQYSFSPTALILEKSDPIQGGSKPRTGAEVVSLGARLLNRDSKHFSTKLSISNYVRGITHAYSWGSPVSGGLQKPFIKSMESIFFDRGRGLERLVGTTPAPTVDLLDQRSSP